MSEYKQANLKKLLIPSLLLGGAAFSYSKYRKHKKEKERRRHRAVPLSKVDSSMIHELGYVPKDRSMYAKFNTGRRYRFKDVPLKSYRQLRDAESIGTHFNKHIRDQYEFEKVSNAVTKTVSKVLSSGGAKAATEGAEEAVKWHQTMKGKLGIAAPTAIVGAGMGATMRDDQGHAGGIGGAISGAMMGAAVPFALMTGGKLLGSGTKAGFHKVTGGKFKSNTPPTTPGAPTPKPAQPSPNKNASDPANFTSTPPVTNQAGQTVVNQPGLNPPNPVDGLPKLSSFEGMCLIDESSFEKVANITPVLAQAAVGAGVGAVAAGEGNRLRGAAMGAGAGAVGGLAGRAIAGAASKANLTAAARTKLTQQTQTLDNTLKNIKGITPRHDAIEAFIKAPGNKEFANVYRSSMQGGLAGATTLGLAGGMATNKTAALRAVERRNMYV